MRKPALPGESSVETDKNICRGKIILQNLLFLKHPSDHVTSWLKTLHGLILVPRIKATLLLRTRQVCASSAATSPAILTLTH